MFKPIKDEENASSFILTSKRGFFLSIQIFPTPRKKTFYFFKENPIKKTQKKIHIFLLTLRLLFQIITLSYFCL